jgi:hypothetical protein
VSKKKKKKVKEGNQLPDPEWARELADGKPEKAKALSDKIDQMAEVFGAEAADDARSEMKKIFGKAALRKIERENPHWNGKTRILP